MRAKLLLLSLLIGIVFSGYAQKVTPKVRSTKDVTQASVIIKPRKFFVSQPVRDMPLEDISQDFSTKIVPRNGIDGSAKMSPKRQQKLAYLRSAGKSPTAVDPLLGKGYEPIHHTDTRQPITFFDGISMQVNPPDPAMAVGPNHIVTMENGLWAVYNKQGQVAPGFPRPLTQPLQAPGSTADAGDPVVIYDRQADRWLITQFQLPANNVFLLGVSQTSDPTGAYNVYEYELTGGNDYPHYSVWGDSYVTSGNFSTNEKIYTFNRQKMLDGDASAEIVGFVPSDYGTAGFAAPKPVHSEGAGVTNGPIKVLYYQDDAFNGISTDHIGLWEITMDWTSAATIAASTISAKTEIATTPFDALIDSPPGTFANLQQPGTTQRIDAIVGAVMNIAHWYKFPSYESILLNWVVEVTDGSQISGIRWVELRSTDNGNTWSVYQEGTFTDPTGDDSVFMGLLTMDIQGNIGLAYTKTGDNVFPSLFYTGRKVNDPLGQMTVAEELAIAGTSSVIGFDRYGDYGHAVRDPLDDLTFWVTSEYSGNQAAQGGRRVGVYSYKIISEYENDVAVTSIDAPLSGVTLTATENVTITVQNFGDTPATNVPISYSLNGGAVVTATIPGPINFLDTASFTFSVNENLAVEGNYTICARTNLVGDEVPLNDEICKTITHYSCLPGSAVTGCNLDGIKRVILGDINADDGGNGCNTEPSTGPSGYSDRTNLATELDRSAGNNTHLLQAQTNYDAAADGVAFNELSAWIDFNNNGTFEASERLITGASFTSAGALNSFNLTIPTGAAGGSHILRLKSFDPNAAGDNTDPCGQVTYGEVQDYTVIIIDSGLNCITTTTYTNTGWDNGAPNSITSATIAANYNVATLGSITTCDLTINSGFTLDLSNGQATVYGNTLNNGNLIGANGAISFSGRSAQTFGGTAATTIVGDIVLDNGTGLTLNSQLEASKLVTLTNGVFNSNGFLVFKSDVSGTGELDIVSNAGASVSGEVTVERFIPAKRAFRFLSSSVTTTSTIRENWQENGIVPPAPEEMYGIQITGSTTGANGFDVTASGNPSMFSFDNAAQTFNAIPNTNVAVLSTGAPYLTLVRGNRSTDLTSNAATPSDAIIRAKGTLNIGNVAQLNFNTTPGTFNFIGNPYQSSVDVVDILTNSLNVNTGQYYIWDPNLGVRGQYVTVILPGGANTSGSNGNRYLQPGQAAFVTTLENGAASVLFEETDKTPGIETTIFAPEDMTINGTPHIIGQLYRTTAFQEGESLQDSFGILFSESFTNDLTPQDAVKPVNIDENMGITQGDATLSLERRRFPTTEDVIPLFNDNYSTDSYTLRMEVSELPNVLLYLVDDFTGIVTELIVGENFITFDINEENSSDAPDRFSIVFLDPALAVIDTAAYDLTLYPNPLSGDTLEITATALSGSEVAVSVSNLLGQKLFTEDIYFTSATATFKGLSVLSSGVYLVTLKSREGSITRRIVKNNNTQL